MTTNISKIRAALELARDYITSDLASERGAFEGYEGVSRIGEIKADLTNNDEALAALAELEKAAAEPVATVVSERGGVPNGTLLRWSAPPVVGAKLYTTPPPAKPAPVTPEQTLSALTAFNEQQGDEYTRMQAALQAAGEVESFQSRVKPWMMETFGAEISSDMLERSDRFTEESLELGQSLGHSKERAHALVEYVYDRPIGEPSQEVGGVMVTLAALCLAANMDMHAAAETELARVWTKIDVIREKQKSKPRGSALPQAAGESK